MHYLKSFVMTLSLFVLTVPVIQAGDVEDINSMVKKKVAVIFDLLGKQDIEKNERNEKIVGELNEIMDFQLAAYLSLGKHWKKISKTQKKEFVETFQQYINNYIVEKIDLYTNQKIDIGDSKIVKKGRAELEIGILSGGETLQVNFKLRKNKKKEWRVYDVDIEGVSLITTFRSQFSGVLKNSSFEELLEKLKNPTEQS
ncbi:MAG: ABC transporter substrate-binding protein [SAR324 cluster bacterium]|jgi:phospholipid transport system substrate-binding protein|nr:ABC transporter substrate-binding protein [SAR324 cluster bacterium]MEC7087480.1 ABC transporter substrate-binding protein [SAR324 cluster bacterium]MEC7630704.1 ABC transporter substrate-binding protein [SAR324 cluster bacterium]MEC8185295.1 ABC transporter substrate-binding protein [SAR324 cluster bacterium]MEC8843692.1 ABC transporter substrate-binding protein [SAR324 cluster bacterium]|tara:strand:+ start:53 stop:649 length:597 start_codon:yes stop_codon:yes gene_type:complete